MLQITCVLHLNAPSSRFLLVFARSCPTVRPLILPTATDGLCSTISSALKGSQETSGCGCAFLGRKAKAQPAEACLRRQLALAGDKGGRLALYLGLGVGAGGGGQTNRGTGTRRRRRRRTPLKTEADAIPENNRMAGASRPRAVVVVGSWLGGGLRGPLCTRFTPVVFTSSPCIANPR
jgi:hypothetical protein